ncbi:excinuclease ABC subunit A [Methanohalophilus euhalobius]|uniref:UvrABC system protein A n=1 Tax=Methanohalophilus euhalobius TaxID=51203 RepID=A0A285FTI5_9EURY|nr:MULTISPECIES: excinuclease ABC subunit UvrA [Methanohalophilus]ODV49814.1 MAG: excinuclease ABC subunit A [Methanohalophilus sp. 2-GBenrich]TCL11438.1 excinuclease ABC subunit A [Methanohalophilus euhalobius]SNY14607.1 Excinuclease ABC subunit A [Methanohalophilus euhalobius]
MSLKNIMIKGAKEHNLKNIDVVLPRDKLIVITGLSGSGKSSLAFDTIYAEGQRRYVESLSSYARQFLGQMEKPNVEYIEGLSPAISIEQKTTSKNPRSTVGTVTEIYDYLRLLFARIGARHCPDCGRAIEPLSVDQIVDNIMKFPAKSKLHILAPVVRERKGEYRKLLADIRSDGYSRARVDGGIIRLDEADSLELGRYNKHNIEIVVDRLSIKEGIEERLSDSVEQALARSGGIVIADIVDGDEFVFSEKLACPHCGTGFEELEPAMFSFNSPQGACDVCHGLGTSMEFDPDLIIPDRSLSLNEGAVEPWGTRKDGYYMQSLQSLADHFGFSMDAPFEDLEPQYQNMILYGTATKVPMVHTGKGGGVWKRNSRFKGVIATISKIYNRTDSENTKDRLKRYISTKPCPACEGERLKPASLSVFIDGFNIIRTTHMSIEDCLHFFEKLELSLDQREFTIARLILKEIKSRLGFLVDVGLDYLTLSRSASTLSGGEAQRIRLATQIGSSLMGVLYILDEPSIGLHQRDNLRLINTLKHLRDIGNTVIVVEHDEETIMSADHVVDMGPGAGIHGGDLVAEGTPVEIMQNPDSLTGRYLKRELEIPVPSERRTPEGFIKLIGAAENNLKEIDVEFPLSVMICVTGVSGSGKSTLINETLNKVLARKLNRARERTGKYSAIEGLENVDKVITIDQSPIGRTPRSNPATYTNLFTPIRELFAQTKLSKSRGYKPGRFSFNVRGGRCETCGGEGIITIEMHFLPDVYVPCEVCHGKRYNRETLEVTYKDKSIADVLDMTVEEALGFFANIPKIKRKLQTLFDVGLGYIKLGQSSTTLSGGEAQRVKLATELSKRSTGKTVYILDEPTTGLHFDDVRKLLEVLQRLVEGGNTVIVIEHNLDVIKVADWIIDLGPEGGEGGGLVVAEGVPENVAKVEGSYTGEFLKNILS